MGERPGSSHENGHEHSVAPEYIAEIQELDRIACDRAQASRVPVDVSQEEQPEAQGPTGSSEVSPGAPRVDLGPDAYVIVYPNSSTFVHKLPPKKTEGEQELRGFTGGPRGRSMAYTERHMTYTQHADGTRFAEVGVWQYRQDDVLPYRSSPVAGQSMTITSEAFNGTVLHDSDGQPVTILDDSQCAEIAATVIADFKALLGAPEV